MIQVLRVFTVLTFALCAWVASVWSHEGRICWKDESLAALHWEEDGVRVAVPRCSPLSYLFQPSLSYKEKRLINYSLKQVREVSALLDRLDLKRTHKIHLVLADNNSIGLRKDLIHSYLKKQSRLSNQQLQVFSEFYANYLRSHSRNENPVWSSSSMTSIMNSNDLNSVSALILSLYFEKLPMSAKSKYLRTIWKSEPSEDIRLEDVIADFSTFKSHFEGAFVETTGINPAYLSKATENIFWKVSNYFRARRVVPVQVQSDAITPTSDESSAQL